MPIIFRKTAKGVAEINTRAHRLLPRLRTALILVDGKRDAADLAGLILQQAAETLAALAEQGFIEAVGETAPAPAARPPAAVAPAPAPAAPTAVRPGADFPTLRRAAVRSLNEALGPTGETLAIRMERARNADELRPLLVVATQLIGKAHGPAAAEAFAARHPCG
jgi:hypothetical protein